MGFFYFANKLLTNLNNSKPTGTIRGNNNVLAQPSASIGTRPNTRLNGVAAIIIVTATQIAEFYALEESTQ